MNSKKKIVSKSKNTKPKKLTAKVANPQTGLPSDGPELRQVEKALRISEDRYRLLVDNANEAILVAQNGMLKFVNRVAGDLTGYSEKELTSIPFPNFIHPDDRDMVVKHHLSQLEGDIIQPKYAFRLNTRDGSTKWVEINAVLIDWEGKPATLNFLSDITERKQAEEVLRESQKLHEKTFASLLDAVFILDNDTTEIKDCNPAASAIFGYSRQEMLSRTTEFLHVDQASLEEFRKHLNADVKEKGFLFLPEFRMKRKDGTVFHSEHSVVPLENEQGNRISWVSVVRDITERKRVEERLQESEDRLRTIVAGTQALLVNVDPDGHFTYANDATARAVGYASPEELVGKSYLHFVHPDDRQQVLDTFINQTTTRQPSIMQEFRITDTQGKVKWFSFLSNLAIKNRQVIGITGVAQDITARKRTEAERQAILEIKQGAVVTESLPAFLELIRQSLAKVINAENFFVVFKNKSNGLFEEVYSVDKYDAPMLPSKLERSMTAYVFRTGEPLLLTQEKFEELVARGEAELVGNKPAIWLGAPLKTPNETIGVIVVQNYEDPHCYLECDKEFLVNVGIQVALAIERKQTEEELRESEEKFKTLFNSANDAIFTMNHTTFLDCNSTTEKIFRCSKDQIVGHSPIDFSPEQQPDGSFSSKSAVEKIESAFAGEPQFFEWLHTHLDGTPFYVEVSLNRIFIGGEVILQAIVRDITERKQAEEALHQSEVELRALFASMHDVVLVIDRDGVYRKIAPTNPGLLVKPPEELLGKTLRDVFQPEQVATFISAVQQVLDTKQTAQIEYDLIIGDQTVRFETSISPMTEDSTLWVAHDITRRKRFELVQNAIFRITKAAITSEGMDALYHSIHSILGELIPTENFYIALYDPVTELISFPYYVDQYDEPPSGPTQIQGLTGYVLCTGRPLLATREVFDRLVGQGEIEAVGTVGVDWMGAPLKAEGRMIGVMAVQSYTEGIHFDQEDLNLLEFVSTQVAQAIERKRLEEEIRNLSLTDELTGLYNRRGFTLLAEQEVKRAHRIKRSMLLFFTDVDDLKVINDTHGHAQGDLALKEVSAILKETFREADIPARIGGDEFVVLAVDASMESAELLTNRIQANLERRNQKGDRAYQMNLSMGIARYDPEVPCTLSELIARADGLMYQQKQARK